MLKKVKMTQAESVVRRLAEFSPNTFSDHSLLEIGKLIEESRNVIEKDKSKTTAMRKNR